MDRIAVRVGRNEHTLPMPELRSLATGFITNTVSNWFTAFALFQHSTPATHRDLYIFPRLRFGFRSEQHNFRRPPQPVVDCQISGRSVIFLVFPQLSPTEGDWPV
jgi:hypothetical protein